MTRQVRIGVLGTGGRGAEAYGRWFVEHPEKCEVVAVADVIAHRRESFADQARVPAQNRFGDWSQLLREANRLGLDGVVIALPDKQHLEPTVRAAQLGLAILLEKPLTPDEATLSTLERKLKGLDSRIAVAHVLRETPFWKSVQRVTESGAIGDIATIRIEENIGFWHFAHSYVRGNWRNTDESSPMVLAKTSHDLDIIRWIAGRPPTRVASFGSLLHFHEGNAPEGAPTHCLKGCPVADTCPFYAPRYYADALAGTDGWPVALLGPDTSREGRMAALAEGPYGRCVYRADNDVVDHQQTVFSFPDGQTATLTTSAFTGSNTRTFQITGTRGELSGRMQSGELRLETFSPDGVKWAAMVDMAGTATVRTATNGPLQHNVYEWKAVPPHSESADHRGHAGGDDALAEQFIEAVASGDFEEHVTTTLAASLDSHWMAFAAERARKTGETQELKLA